ncbi:phosphotransferase [Pedobacter sp. UBA5917]|jgi:thiamine kinase-like enzyme|uniref:phosphotransferase n=1 Tax=Pedobacter sp. UBA5917 TaxID=1947061 RepID=UPI0025E63C5E|nr:phosphotransferase [Pedobacter sp. UBA5917]
MFPDLFSTLPADRIEAVQSALKQILPGIAITEISLLSGGLSGSLVYRFAAENKNYTLKLNPPAERDSVFSDNLLLASDAGVAPKLYYNNPEQGIIISTFIDNKPVRGIFSPDQLAVKLAEKIRAMHAVISHSKVTDLFATVDGLIDWFKSTNKLGGVTFEECFELYGQIKEKYPLERADLVFSHNDLNPNNILCDGKNIWIIDWDVASINNRYIDLANAANYFVHTIEDENAFLKTYFGKAPNDHQKACFYLMRPVCRIIYSLMMFQLAFHAKSADFKHNQEMEGMDMASFGALIGSGKISLAEYDGQLMYGKTLMNTALAQMRADRFAESLTNL